MSAKTLVFWGMIIGSTIGGAVPELFGAGIFSYWSLLGSGIGGVLGVIIGYKLANV